MGIFREIPPTAGFPLGLRNFFLSAGKSNESLQNSVKKYLNLPYAEITCSGTGALYLIMETIKELSPKRTVIIPSFICPLVPLAIKRAGFNIKVCDIGTHDFNYNYSQLETLCTQDNDIVAVIACHLAGIPIDLQSLLSLTKNKNIFLIEDAAQALGSSYQGRPVGTWGDFALFSLCRGKGMTLYEGGVVATNNEYYGHFLDKKFKEIIKFDFLTEAKRLFELLGYALFYRPLLFWGVFKLPQLYWEMRGNKIKALGEDFAINFPLHGVSQMRKSIGQSQFHSLENHIVLQREKAQKFIDELGACQGITIVQEGPGNRANYPFLTLIFDHPARQQKALALLSYAGWGVSQIYALAISDYPYLKDLVPDMNCAQARQLAKRIITLSTSIFMTDDDLQSIIDKLKAIVSGN